MTHTTSLRSSLNSISQWWAYNTVWTGVPFFTLFICWKLIRVSFCCHDVICRTQARRGSGYSSPQQSGTSRTVKRYPSSSEPITSNALPSSNGFANSHGSEHRSWYSHRNRQSFTPSLNGQRPPSDSHLQGQFNNVLHPAGKKKTTFFSIFITNLKLVPNIWFRPPLLPNFTTDSLKCGTVNK